MADNSIRPKGFPAEHCQFSPPTTPDKKAEMNRCVATIKQAKAQRKKYGQTCETHMNFVGSGKNVSTLLTLVCEGSAQKNHGNRPCPGNKPVTELDVD